MADVSHITALNGVTYDIKDATARTNLQNKLDVAQGTSNAGKFLVVGSDGNITTVTLTEWSGGSY